MKKKKINISDRTKKAIIISLKFPIASTNKGGKIAIMSNIEIIMVFTAIGVLVFVVYVQISHAVIMTARSEPQKAIVTIVSLVKPCVA